MVQWDSELLEFLMQVSVVEEFTLPLAELITANRLASVMVQKALETGNFLFQEDGVYRLRQVLLHALRERALQVLGEEQVKTCRKNAGVWYEMDVSFHKTCKTQDGPTFQHEKMWKTPGNGLNTRFFRGKPLAYR